MFVINVENFEPTQRLEAWRDAAANLIHPMAVSTQQSTLERGHIRVSEAYGLKAIRVAGCQSRVERNSQQIDPGETRYVQLTMLAHGELLIEQGEQRGKLQSGQITWYQSNSPYRIEAPGSFDLFHFLISDQHKSLIQEALAPLPAHPLSQNSPSTQILTGFLGGIAQSQVRTQGSRRQGLLEDTLLHLLRTLGQDHATNESDQEWSIFEAALSFIRSNIRQPRLGPQNVAQHCHVSVRQIHRIFAEEGTTVGAQIREIRLNSIAQELLDSDNTSLSVGDIARKWGFTSPAHFSRTFKAHFGQSPRQMRSSPSASTRFLEAS